MLSIDGLSDVMNAYLTYLIVMPLDEFNDVQMSSFKCDVW